MIQSFNEKYQDPFSWMSRGHQTATLQHLRQIFSLNLSDTNLIFMVLMLALLGFRSQINRKGVVEAIRINVTVWPYLPEAVHGVVSTRTFIVGARHFPGCGKAL